MADGHGLRLSGIEGPVKGDQDQAEKQLADEAAQRGAPVLQFHPAAHPENTPVCSHRPSS